MPLLSDFNGDAIRGFGVARQFREFEDVAERAAFLIDTAGIVRGAWRYRDDEVPDLDVLLKAARALGSS